MTSMLSDVSKAEIADAIRGGVGVIEKKGWCQHRLQDRVGRVCMFGGVREYLNINENTISIVGHPEEDVYFAATRMLNNAVDTALIEDDGGLLAKGPLFNDMPGRTEEEVKKFMLGVADKVEFEDA